MLHRHAENDSGVGTVLCMDVINPATYGFFVHLSNLGSHTGYPMYRCLQTAYIIPTFRMSSEEQPILQKRTDRYKTATGMTHFLLISSVSLVLNR